MVRAEPSPVDRLAEELERLLRDLLIEHEQLLSLASLHRRAIAAADAELIRACLNEQNRVVQLIGELEKRRLTLLRSAVDDFGEPEDGASTLAWIAAHLDEPHRERILALGGHLRDRITHLRRRHQTIREAAESLARHMDGLIRQVGGRLSHAGTYGRTGGVAAGSSVTTALDLTL